MFTGQVQLLLFGILLNLIYLLPGYLSSRSSLPSLIPTMLAEAPFPKLPTAHAQDTLPFFHKDPGMIDSD